MGYEFRTKDITNTYRKIIEDSMKDLSPDMKDEILKLLQSWEGKNSAIKLEAILGKKRIKSLINKIRTNSESLNEEDEKNLKDLFKESITFD
ncbi:MAG TPA: hypothetical protein VK250_11220 [Nitrososphaeraceae archaeon]|nr:hypothetical protein [Nitrososphaeraceae archaeon]